MLPLILAVTYAFVVLLVRGLADPAQVVDLALGYAAAIGSVAAFAAAIWLLFAVHRAGRGDERVSLFVLVKRTLTTRMQADRCLSLWQPLVVFVVMMTAFSVFKQTALPSAGFGLGPAIARADHALFGTDAWHVTHWLFPSAWATQFIDLAYHAWFAPMTLGIVLCAFAPPGSVLATRYLMAYCLLWIVQGSYLAYVMPAAGPVYFQYFQAHSDHFIALTHLLAAQDVELRAAGAPGITALTFQDYLLHLFGHRMVALGGGISAMPSLHNAMAILFACAARHISRPLGVIFALYAALIWAGSVHLGWHYALDGIVALAATVATWRVTGGICDLIGRARAADEARRDPIAVLARIRIS